uniref:Uncharacterized protein n=1 Tax=Fagus sylvatica TaxID=28930 RepID=A0A2N9G6J7_FAGSY
MNPQMYKAASTVQFKQYEIAKKIVCLHGCLAMQTNSKGNTPLHVAAKVGNPQMEGDTALHIAVQYGNFEVVKELIKEDPKLAMCVNNVGESVLFLAVDRDLYDIASHILSATPRMLLVLEGTA